MADILDVFSGDAFSLMSMTARVNAMPFVPGRLGELGLFEPESITDNVVALEERAGLLVMVPNTQRGAPAPTVVDPKRTARSFNIPHLPQEDRIMASSVQSVRAFGSASIAQTVQGLVDRKVAAMARNLDATLEHLRMGAVKGTILDSDGSTVIYNLFTQFGVSQAAEVTFNLAAATRKALIIDCNLVTRTIQDNLGNIKPPRIHAFCSSSFWDAFTTHDAVKTAFERFQDGSHLREGWVRRGFTIFGIEGEEYRGAVGGVKFIADDKVQFVPGGVPELFREIFGPMDSIPTANTPGLPRYAQQAIDAKWQQFVDLRVESNPLPICVRPTCLMVGTLAA